MKKYTIYDEDFDKYDDENGKYVLYSDVELYMELAKYIYNYRHTIKSLLEKHTNYTILQELSNAIKKVEELEK